MNWEVMGPRLHKYMILHYPPWLQERAYATFLLICNGERKQSAEDHFEWVYQPVVYTCRWLGNKLLSLNTSIYTKTSVYWKGLVVVGWGQGYYRILG